MIKILFVEDDLPLALGMEYTLKQEGFDVIHAKNLSEARAQYKNNEFNIILLDVMLPDGTGYEFCKIIRESSEIPIIFMTACDEEGNVVMGLDMGGDDYITKPIRVKELVSRINAVLRRKGVVPKKEENKNKIISGDITVELLKYKVYKNDKVIELTTIEYKLLLLLIKNNGNVLERNLLLERLWDTDGNFVDGNSLTVYIKRLREKVEDDIKTPTYIETVRGIGYRWAKEVREA
ncbi:MULTISPECIES: response regulator transcription factor [unclassified Clostridium]|uniref:response regulator transcription factor n=1 Tax=Clostridium TaxID=1485 RepID=UPI001C8C0544|nr:MULTISPECIES: response regulator transcription factor [unclassified Clostridium]MBX9137818.1 response regulator transcription factor [Clostridium sp. K12(2020)]MBX9143527.1 response regulator transcription factor [Clostridium sp. K13]MDU2291679.1 response regulator transcription factor [Clostridium celatum]MDU4326171.1 response regulator transcription factor [Clostridium celatum]